MENRALVPQPEDVSSTWRHSCFLAHLHRHGPRLRVILGSSLGFQSQQSH